ncbi:uncharacterized protein RCC_00989 [Ramularia collo-cygni]|uniref:CENP-V/GFA domain-containing protein n=1 Tax=Ramularia collo-cygni TaxID=112498 RepID=A0A2D3V0Q6_9PEZI|nr:uncharacterized protein RCC_00989 [Ramularia collo-cygni]CZT15089.1 uncharacterized protein RCC_00989 [Ramularia collo-cygni]
MSTPTNSSKPFQGSCHCGKIQYIAYLTLPPKSFDPATSPSTSIRIYKCNCSTCVKLGMFHLRLEDSPRDFLVLSPLNFEDPGVLGDYRTFAGEYHWYFCNECGVRCFAFAGADGKGGRGGEVIEIDMEAVGDGGKKTIKVWRPLRKGWVEGKVGYLSINATTLEQDQEGLDLRDWAEKGYIYYIDCKERVESDQYGRPHAGGIY